MIFLFLFLQTLKIFVLLSFFVWVQFYLSVYGAYILKLIFLQHFLLLHWLFCSPLVTTFGILSYLSASDKSHKQRGKNKMVYYSSLKCLKFINFFIPFSTVFFINNFLWNIFLKWLSCFFYFLGVFFFRLLLLDFFLYLFVFVLLYLCVCVDFLLFYFLLVHFVCIFVFVIFLFKCL